MNDQELKEADAAKTAVELCARFYEMAEKVIDSVPELPGHMPPEMWADVQKNEISAEEWFRATVRETKRQCQEALRMALLEAAPRIAALRKSVYPEARA